MVYLSESGTCGGFRYVYGDIMLIQLCFNEFLVFHEYSDDVYEVWESFDQKGILVIFGKVLRFPSSSGILDTEMSSDVVFDGRMERQGVLAVFLFRMGSFEKSCMFAGIAVGKFFRRVLWFHSTQIRCPVKFHCVWF